MSGIIARHAATIKTLLICAVAIVVVVVAMTTVQVVDRQHPRNLLQTQHRHLQSSSVNGNLFGLLGSSSFCRKVNFNTREDLYQTVQVRNIFAFIIRWFYSDVEGECGDVCEDICNHEPCVQDFVTPDDTLCECFANAKSSCGTNTRCNSANDNCECNKGYEGNPLTICTDINECNKTANPCGANGACINTEGAYNCNCNPGYQFLNGTCVDVNECRVGGGTPCGPFANCTNTVGSFTCACQKGFIGSPPSTFCADINECAPPISACGPNGQCTNIDGAYTCQCNLGYRSTAPIGGCVDRDECNEANTTTCIRATENCLNTQGSFVCTCKPGFTGTPGSCTDVNECLSDPPLCGANSVCNNTVGSYGCACQPGFFTTPPNCRKLNAFEKCTIGSDCNNGLVCALTSRSDTSTRSCCTTTGRCNTNQDCCNGAYTNGQTCPSSNSLDCRDGATCANRGPFDSTKVCCRNTYELFSQTICS